MSSISSVSTIQPPPRIPGMGMNHAMLVAMVLICGVNIYIAIQMKKRMDKADALLGDMAQVAGTSADLDRLATAIKTEPPPVDTASSVSSEITVLRTVPPKKRAKKDNQ
jgi:hypothetical protein